MRLVRLVLAYLALAVALTWPAALHPVASVPGGPRTDLWDSLWSMWFLAERLASGASPLRVDGLLNPPVGGSLWIADPLNALLGLPLLPLLGPAATWTLLVLAHLTFVGLAGHALGREVGDGGDAAGAVTGVGVASAPILLSQVQNGASEAVSGGWVVVGLLAVLRLRRTGTLRWGVALGLALGVGTVAHWYGGMEAWLAVGCAGVAEIWRAIKARSARSLAPWALAVAIGLALAAPPAVVARSVTTAKDTVVGIKGDKELATLRRTIGPADPVGFLMPGRYRSPDFAEISRYGERYVHCNYLGWTLLVGAALGWRRGRQDRGLLVAVAVVGGVLACGPVLARYGGPVILPGRLGIPLPYILLERLPGFSGLSLLYRLTWLPVICLAALAARGWVGRWAPVGVVLCLVETRLLSPAADLPEHTDCTASGALQTLAKAPPGAVMNWPVEGDRPYLFEQTVHGHPVAATLNFPDTLASKRVWRVAMVHRADTDAGLKAAVGSEAESAGVRYLVLHDDASAEPSLVDPAAARMGRAFPVLAAEGPITVVQLW